MDKIKKLNKRKRLLKLIIILIIVGLGYFTYMFINSPKIKIIRSLQNFSGISRNINTEYGNLFNSQVIGFKSNNTISIKDSLGLTNDLSPIELNLEYIEDNNKRMNYIDLDTKIKNKSLINLIGTNKDNKFYYTLNNIYDNYYYVDSDYITLFKNNVDKNIQNALVKALFNNIKNEKFTKSNANDTLNGNQVTLTKTSISLNTNELKMLMNNFKSELSKVNAGGKYNYIINVINEFINSENKSNTIYKYSMYESNNGLVKQDIQIIDNDNKLNYTISYYDYDNKNGLKIINGEDTILDILVSTLDKNKDITGTIGNLNVSGKIDADKILITMKDEKEDNILKIDGDINTKEVKKDSEYNKDYNINLSYTTNNISIFSMNIKSNINIFNNKEIEDKDYSNALESDKVTKSDQNKLSESLLKHDFMNNIGSIFNNELGQ